MFRKLLSKLIGNTAGTIVDAVVTEAIDAKTGGAATKIEDAVEGAKKARKKRSGS